MEDFVTNVVSSFSSLLGGIGSGIVDLFNTLILTNEGKLTTFATWIAVFIGISVVFWIVRAVLKRV